MHYACDHPTEFSEFQEKMYWQYIFNALWCLPVDQPNKQPCLYERIGGEDGLAFLLRPFYSDVRQHALLGPIFNGKIQDWPAHLETIGLFWARLTGGPSVSAGQMPAQHLSLGLEARHFSAWLQLWDFNCCRHLHQAEAEKMICLARAIGQRLKHIVLKESLADSFERISEHQKYQL